MIKSDLAEVANTHGDERRTRIAAEASEDFNEEDLIPESSLLIAMSPFNHRERFCRTS